MIEGDARETLPRWQGQADAWYLDGFSPAKNPELWGADLMAEVGPAHQTRRHGGHLYGGGLRAARVGGGGL